MFTADPQHPNPDTASRRPQSRGSRLPRTTRLAALLLGQHA